jgi:choice-of-anchor A domain-containing protein
MVSMASAECDLAMCGLKMHPIRYLPKLAVTVGLLAAPAAMATPYDTLESIAGTYNMFLTGNLGSASSPFQYSDVQGNVAVAGDAYINGSAINGNNTSGSAALVVGGNLTQTYGSIQGNAYVGGNATLTGVGSVQNLVVGGNLNDTSGTINGNVFVGGTTATLNSGVTINGSLNMTGANSTLNAANNGGSNPGGGIYVTSSTTVNKPSYWSTPHTSGGPATPPTPLDVFGTTTDLKNASTSLTALSGATNVSSNGGTINITLTKNGLNVINLTLPNGATVNSVNITNANGVTPTGLIINVNGNNLTFTNGSFTYPSGLGADDVLYNFGNAASITASNIAFEGALLAPLATVNFNNGHIDGAVLAANYTGSAQVNYVGLDLQLPSYQTSGDGSGGTTVATPEPGTLALFGTGLLVMGLFFRRRAKGAPCLSR